MIESKKQETLISRFIQEPYRVFFPLGAILGLAGVGYWILYGLGIVSYYSGVLHGAVLTEAFMGCFVVGFLTTAFPRFTASFPCKPWEFYVLLALILSTAFFHFMGLERAGRGAYAGWILALAVFAGRRAAARKKSPGGFPVSPPAEMVWIGVGIVHAFAGWLLFEAASAGKLSYEWLAEGRRLSDQGFLLCIVLGIGSFLGSRLMGTFRMQPGAADPERVKGALRVKASFHLAAGSLVLLSHFLEGAGYVRSAFLVRSAVLTAVFIYTGALALRPVNRETLVWGVWLSFWLIAAGHWGVVFLPVYRIEWMHLIFLGGYSLMTFSVASMVMISHAGEASRLRKPLGFLKIVYAAILTALIIRLSAPFFLKYYFFILAAASTVWSAAILYWLTVVAPCAVRFADPELLEKAHEEAKKRILEGRKTEIC